MADIDKKTIGKCLCIGAAAGVANGFFGAGGGLLLVPGFLWLLKMDTNAALPTSVSVILPLCVVSVFFYMGSGHLIVDWWILGGGLAGGVLGGLLYGRVPKLWLRRAFGALILYSALRILLTG